MTDPGTWKPPKTRWRQRRTVQALKRDIELEDSATAAFDADENERTRLPDGEEVRLGGLVLTEAFTPSTVSSLYRVLENWPDRVAGDKEDRLKRLEASRGGEGGGWQNLGVVVPSGGFAFPIGHTDPSVPPGVAAIWIQVAYVTPALAMVVGTFTFTEDAGDLTGLLREDYRTKNVDVYVRVYGRLGGLRAQMPWARPASHRGGYTLSSPLDQKRDAAEALITGLEEACSRWFYGKFPGRFSTAGPKSWPMIRMLFTQLNVPFGDGSAAFQPIGPSVARPLWHSIEPEGWRLTDDPGSPLRERRRYTMTLAARRSDVAGSSGKPDDARSNWALTQLFGTYRATLAAHYAITALLGVYSHGLGELRDQATMSRFVKRRVRDARELNDYLIRDGLDAATVTSDLAVLTGNKRRFEWGLPRFAEAATALNPQPNTGSAMEFASALRLRVRAQATRLAADTVTTTGNIKASAELQQAITNTMLQRFVVLLAVIAIIVSVVGLAVGAH